MMSGGPAGSGSVQHGRAASGSHASGGARTGTRPAQSGETGSMRTPRRAHGNENVNVQQTPHRTPNSATGKGFFTPSRSGLTASKGQDATPQHARTGRRDLGAGTLHLWNIQQTPATPSSSGAFGVDGDVRFAALYLKCAYIAGDPRVHVSHVNHTTDFTALVTTIAVTCLMQSRGPLQHHKSCAGW